MPNVTKGWRVAMDEIGAAPRHLETFLATRRVVQETTCGSLYLFACSAVSVGGLTRFPGIRAADP
jgi:hypothetical protein